jgi:hypothetical protein
VITEPTHYRGLLVDWGGVMTTNVFHVESGQTITELERLLAVDLR